MTEKHAFPILATVTLGRLRKGYLYLEALRHMNTLFANSVEEIVPKIPCAEVRREVDLVVLTPSEAGLPMADQYDRFLAVAVEQGLELCPAEVGPALLVARQPDAWLYIAMEPIPNGAGLGVKLQLGTMWGKRCLSTQAPSFVGPDDRWVFVQPKG
jgi:hypothetical protein